jgi:PKD repeat protein
VILYPSLSAAQPQEDYVVNFGESRVFTTPNIHMTSQDEFKCLNESCRVLLGTATAISSENMAFTACDTPACDCEPYCTCQDSDARLAVIASVIGMKFDIVRPIGTKFEHYSVQLKYKYDSSISHNHVDGTTGTATFSYIFLEKPDVGRKVEYWTWPAEDSSLYIYDETRSKQAADTVTLTWNGPYVFEGTNSFEIALIIYTQADGCDCHASTVVTLEELRIIWDEPTPSNTPPIASFEYDPSDPQVGESVNFTSTSYDLNNDVLSCSWSIKDNEGTLLETFDTEDFSYVFDKEGAYTVNLVVSDGLFTDETFENLGVIISEPTVTPCASQLSREMHDEYQVCYAIKNNAKIPIVVNLNIKELRENLSQTLPWNPFTIDPAPKSSTIEVWIDAEQTQRLWFPDDDYYSHGWYWISPDCWMENYKVFGINYNQLYFNPLGSFQEIIDWTKAAYQSIYAEIPTLKTVDYLLKGQASWGYGASVATYDLAIPDVNITIDIQPKREENLTNMRNEFAKAFVATKTAYLLVDKNPLLLVAAGSFFIAECHSLKQSLIDFKEALDPPDYDYTSVVLPEPIAWPEVEALPNDQLPEFKAMLKKMLEQLSYKNAHIQTLAKYEGAMLSDDSEWKAVQLEKMHYYSRKIEESIAEQVALYQSLIPHLPEITPEMINNAKQLLVNEGLPQIERDILTREMGLTETQIQELTEGLISAQDTWPQSYEEFKNFLLASLITTHSIALEELSELIDVRINELKEAVIEPSAKDFEIIEEVRLELEAMMAAGDYSPAFLHKIEVLRDAYEELLKYTNNYSALEIYNQTLTNAFMSLKTDSIGDACDADGDGIPDDVDNCPESNLEQAIIIVGCDSGVENLLFEDGCTMSDLIVECADGAKNHGKFVSCVSHLTNDWKKQKLISGKEKGAIQSCAAQADIP